MERSLFACVLTAGTLALTAGMTGCADSPKSVAPAAAPLKYPEAAKVAQVDDYHGTQVADPYRWLENPDSPESRAWIEAENKLTFAYLASIPERESIKERLTKLWNYEKYTTPAKEGGKYFYGRNDGLQNHNVLYVADALNAPARVLIDPNTFSKDGTVSLAGTAVSDDAKYIAYGTADGGSDWNVWHVREVATGRDLPDELKRIKFSGASWTKDSLGFYYSRYPDAAAGAQDLRDANYFQKIYYHLAGTPQSQDVLVYERPDQKEWGFGAQVTDDGKYLAITVSQGTETKNRFFYKSLAETGAKVVELIPDLKASYNFIDNFGPVFFFVTDLDAPRGRIIAIDTASPEPHVWKEIVPQGNETLQGAQSVGGKLIASYLKDAYTVTRVYDFKGALVREVKFPGIGTAGGFGGKRSDPETFYSFTSFTSPATVYRYDVNTGESSVFKAPKVDFNGSDYVTEQKFFTSKDGTKVPMFITYKKGMKRNGSNPTLLYGYGGFNISMTPSFSVSNAVWLEMGGVYAVANMRGGGEYGEDWHQAGTKLRKQNVFDDFIAAGEYLVKEKYTSPAHLGVFGGSNGGLLIGAVVNQRPDLFGAAVPAVGVMDMLRFHTFTIGWAWKSDYGSSEDPEQFKALYAYSPLHNIKPGTKYPAVMVTTGDHDDRVVPAHSFKYAATLQAANAGDRPTLIRIETRAGHGAGKPTAMQIEESADRLAFFAHELGLARN